MNSSQTSGHLDWDGGGLAEERITTRAWRNRSGSTDCRHLDETWDRAFRGVGEGEGKGGLEVDVGCCRRGFGEGEELGGRGMGMLVWVQKRRGDVGTVTERKFPATSRFTPKVTIFKLYSRNITAL